MLSDWELWACANQVLKAQGDNAAQFVAEKIGALALGGDDEGIKAWQAIARRITELSDQIGPTTRQ